MARREHWSKWFTGTESEWKAMPMDERDTASFKATGCAVAYPTWDPPVDCVHPSCVVLRGERKPISLINGALFYEGRHGWLRFNLNSPEGRTRNARIYRAVRNQARATGVYDLWKVPGAWAALVFGGVSA